MFEDTISLHPSHTVRFYSLLLDILKQVITVVCFSTRWDKQLLQVPVYQLDQYPAVKVICILLRTG